MKIIYLIALLVTVSFLIYLTIKWVLNEFKAEDEKDKSLEKPWLRKNDNNWYKSKRSRNFIYGRLLFASIALTIFFLIILIKEW